MAKRFYCEGCGYGWISKKPYGEPAYCPRCRSDNIEEDKSSSLGSSFLAIFKKKSDLDEVERTAKLEREEREEAQKQCGYCGKNFHKKSEIKGECQHFWKLGLEYLCKKCAKECKKCGKIFCPKHIKKHRC